MALDDELEAAGIHLTAGCASTPTIPTISDEPTQRPSEKRHVAGIASKL